MIENKAIRIQQTPGADVLMLAHGKETTEIMRLCEEDARELFHQLGEFLQNITDKG